MTKRRFPAFAGFCLHIPRPGCIVLPFVLLKSFSDIVHCRDVHSALAGASFVYKVIIWKSMQS